GHDLFATAFFARSTQLVSRMAEIIGKPDEAARYGKLADDIRTAFNQNFVAPDGRITGNTQGGYALALSFGLLPGDLRQKAAEYLAESIRKTYSGHLSTGIQTTHRAMLELSKNGYHDLAWQLITNRSFPSWLYMVDNGATTIWERWDGFVKGRGFQDPGMNSLNHWALGSVGEWMWRYIIGINPDEEQPGWKHFTIAPMPGGRVTWARGDYESIHGTISSSWEIKDGQFHLTVTVPANTTAEIQFPGGGETITVGSGVHKFVQKH
ncbi:MAG TPA: alpha-L-rhamnosidase, partial [Bacteroidales bacterium]|nr:alpha-L-rhamnosidase [Bacteroidales bacterium]